MLLHRTAILQTSATRLPSRDRPGGSAGAAQGERRAQQKIICYRDCGLLWKPAATAAAPAARKPVAITPTIIGIGSLPARARPGIGLLPAAILLKRTLPARPPTPPAAKTPHNFRVMSGGG